MVVPDLARLERVGLRMAWMSEPADFTPWPTVEQNLRSPGSQSVILASVCSLEPPFPQ
jgi:hypothetical protein